MADNQTPPPGEHDLPTNRGVMLASMGEDGAISVIDLDMPAPEDDGVVIHVAAASINPVDWKIRDGEAPFVEEDDLPVPMGRDCAGTVALTGPAAHNMIRRGDRVMAHVGDMDRGGQARFVKVKATEFTAVPENVDLVKAAAAGLVGMTAWQGLFDHGRLEPGQKVLIHGGAGGVGHVAVQLARIKGATVYATCSADDVEFVKSLGAEKAVDYEAERFEDEVSEVDLVFDLIGGEVQERSFAVIRDGGTLVTTLAENETADPPRGIRTESYMAQPNMVQMSEILGHMAEGRLKVTVAQTLPLEQASEAYDRDRDGHKRGKTMLVMEEG